MNVELQFEIQDNMGATIKVFWKKIKMPAAPTQDLVFNEQDFTFSANRSIIYTTETQMYLVRRVEYSVNVKEFIELFKKLGWKTTK